MEKEKKENNLIMKGDWYMKENIWKVKEVGKENYMI